MLSHNSFLLVGCEPGKYSEVIERSRIVLEEGTTERLSVCEPCPVGTFADEIGSSVCKECPKYHTTLTTGAASVKDCIGTFDRSLCIYSCPPALYMQRAVI